ncbi:MAG: TIGR03790 family protein [Deltaproteobacteria bacterium]|nr:TIGR03790 family protein [Deltaproteobacteria bacterium]
MKRTWIAVEHGRRSRGCLLLGVLFFAFTASGGSAWAVPGPDSVVVVPNRNVPGSLALAERYRATRQIPRSQVCPVDLPATDTISLSEFRRGFVRAVAACLGDDNGRIEAVVLVRGLPLRVTVPIATGTTRVSFAAAAALHQTTTSTGGEVLGMAPGQPVNCGGGNTCYGARLPNGFLRQGPFEPGWSREFRGFVHRPRLVTMLHGRSDEDAARLIASATTAEALGGAAAEHLFMNGADPARGVRDQDYDGAIAALTALGQTATRVPFDANLSGRSLASYFVGTAGLGATIEGNTFLPGALVDNLTSFGALPPNFEAPANEVQVSIARWVTLGVAGVHGTTDEPLNNVFPDRDLSVDYVEGASLGEVYFRYLPFAYWHNLVLGDPMAAPYAVRPVVNITGLSAGARVAGDQPVRVEVTDPLDRPISALRLFLDGRLIAESTGTPIELCLSALGSAQLLAVAQVGDDGTPASKHRPKGWRGFDFEVTPGPLGCQPELDAGVQPDAASLDDLGITDSGSGVDAGLADASDVGFVGPPDTPAAQPECGCRSTYDRGGLDVAWIFALVVFQSRKKSGAKTALGSIA